MEIITKFSMGDEVWAVHQNKAIALKIIAITAII